MCHDLAALTELEATVVVGHGFDRLVERAEGGALTAPAWAVSLARAEIRSWATGEEVPWDRAWACQAEEENELGLAAPLRRVA